MPSEGITPTQARAQSPGPDLGSRLLQPHSPVVTAGERWVRTSLESTLSLWKVLINRKGKKEWFSQSILQRVLYFLDTGQRLPGTDQHWSSKLSHSHPTPVSFPALEKCKRTGWCSYHPWGWILLHTEKDECMKMFATTLFTIAKAWKHPKSVITGEWVKTKKKSMLHPRGDSMQLLIVVLKSVSNVRKRLANNIE